MWGYRCDEVELPPIWPLPTEDNTNEIRIDPSLKILKFRDNDRNLRRPVAGSLGMHVEGAACPHPDLDDSSTTLEGALYRFGIQIPGYGKYARAFRRFVKKWCVKNLKPLSPDTDVSVETWLKGTNYSQARKNELLLKYSKIRDPYDPKHSHVKSFVKDEFYPDYKHARGINSRSDEFKCLTGPIFQRIGEVLFARPEFIKKIPVHDRPKYILDRIYQEGGKYISTDFSSFEAHFREDLMKDCEFIMYRHMVQALPSRTEFTTLVESVIGGMNRIEFKNIILRLLAHRMSGEMNTSSGNGFSNLMFIEFICKKILKLYNIKTIIEGDDSLTSFVGKTPTTEQFKDFGLRIKIEEHLDMCRASFCGMVFDIEEQANVSDPREVLATFGWTTNRYIRSKPSVHKTLLRCKALSLAYQYPACPILSSLAKTVLRLTKSHETHNFVEKQGKFLFNQYDIELFKLAEMRNKQGKLLFEQPGPRTRSLVEELYGISTDQQLVIERYFESLEVIGPIDSPAVLTIMPPNWKDYYNRYHQKISPDSVNYDYPTQLWPAIRKRSRGILSA